MFDLKRSRTDCVFGGVCGGLGEHTQIPSWAWRAMFLLGFVFVGALSLMIYCILDVVGLVLLGVILLACICWFFCAMIKIGIDKIKEWFRKR